MPQTGSLAVSWDWAATQKAEAKKIAAARASQRVLVMRETSVSSDGFGTYILLIS
jgi:hypothetical protein